jgi:putative endonuclease
VNAPHLPQHLPPHLQRGSNSEQVACDWLQHRGLVLVEKNYRCRYGELDLIMLDEECLVIIEVRYRRDLRHGGALESVTREKQKRLGRATEHLLRHQQDYLYRPLRFDVVAVSGTEPNIRLDWRRDAFRFDGN